jgi:hypothetical protein
MLVLCLAADREGFADAILMRIGEYCIVMRVDGSRGEDGRREGKGGQDKATGRGKAN